MPPAWDAPEIRDKSRALGHPGTGSGASVPIIDANPRRGGKAEAEAEARAKRCAGYELAEDVRLTTSAARPSASTAT